MSAVCQGGVYIISAYFWCSEGASQRNLALLQAIARHVRQLHGPWILAADFNFPPSLLEGTGWPRLVEGYIVSAGQPMCKDGDQRLCHRYDVACRSAGGCLHP